MFASKHTDAVENNGTTMRLGDKLSERPKYRNWSGSLN